MTYRSKPKQRFSGALRLSCIAASLCALGATDVLATDGCTQRNIDNTTAPPRAYQIQPRSKVTPFYQWESNNGYCGETSMIQAGFNNGQYMSQFNARRVCGVGLDQAGTGQNFFCRPNETGTPNYNAQLLLEKPGENVTGTQPFASATTCLANARLSHEIFPFMQQPLHKEGLRHFLGWIKREMLSGNQVTIGVLVNQCLEGASSCEYSGDSQYDHIVTVVKIGTDHDPKLYPGYFDDDVLYIDDHGLATTTPGNPAIPPGAAGQPGCAPYVYGYTFASLGRTRLQANGRDAPFYSLLIPEARTTWTVAGGPGNGVVKVPANRSHNYGFSVSGAMDDGNVANALKARPVEMTISGPTQPRNYILTNPHAPIVGYNYENPMIGHSNFGAACTNQPPAAWMDNVVLNATVKRLTIGHTYNCYKYEMSSIPVTNASSAAALRVPTGRFNERKWMANERRQFVATATTYRFSFATSSDKIVAMRCVDALAP